MIATGSITKDERKLSAAAEQFCRRFSLAEVQLATEDFSEAHLIGNGGFGKVYRGRIDDGQQTVAIKRLAPNSNQGEGEFMTEIETLSKLRHVNLVSLIGYCNENEEMILVYEYIPRGTLADHLYKFSRSGESDNCSFLTWKQRLHLCIGAARGLDYLHTGTSIVHRDVKSTNILLAQNFTAKVSDFGLAKHFTSNSKSHVSTIVKGTFGYLDPSYFTTCRLTRKSDTYAFGVVLLEVLCGRPAVDLRLGEDEISLVMWAREKISKGKVDQIVASNLRDEISDKCLITFVGIAKRCLNLEPKKRPTMAQVVVQLEVALEQQDKKAPTLNASRFLSFWNRVKTSGSTQKDHKQGDVHTLSTAITATQDETLNDKHTIKMLLVEVPAISIHELKHITDNFSSNCLSGNVYRGILNSGQVAAIKKLSYSLSSLPDEEFVEQVSMVSSLENENVARLLGYCMDGWEQFLVYEFAQKGSLHDNLHRKPGSKPDPTLGGCKKDYNTFTRRDKFHCNITSRNILIYDDEVAKLAYFGRSTPSTFERQLDDSAVFQPGGYLPPEYYFHVEFDCRIDVYSFGVVLLELLTGHKLYDHTRPRGQEHLIKWATPWLSEDKVTEIVDARLNGDYPPKAVAKMARIASLCVQYEHESRPDMRRVVKVLNDLAEQPTH